MKSFIANAIVAGLMLSGAAVADTINVPGDYPTIQGAIDASSNGDVISIDGGIYYEYNLNTNGKAITLLGATDTNGNPTTVVDAQQQWRVLNCNSGEDNNTIIKNIELTGGLADQGGGVDINGASPLFDNCVFSMNEAINEAGGMMIQNADEIIITSCKFIANDSADRAACIRNEGSVLNVSNSLFQDNGKDGCDGSYQGAAISIEGGVTSISSCQFINNSGVCHGAIGGDGNLDIHDTVFIGNTESCCGGDGAGGAAINMNLYSSSSLLLDNCQFLDNQTGWHGGAILLSGPGSGGDDQISDCLFEGNRAENQWDEYGKGGAIFCNESSPVITDCVIANNNCSNYGGGIYMQNGAAPVLADTIVCGNTPQNIFGQGWIDKGGNQILAVCDSFTGACCIEGECVTVSFEACEKKAGEWQGYDTVCDDEICAIPPVFGACCINGQAIALFDYDCDRVLGQFMGAGSDPNTIDCPADCPGDTDNNGEVDVNDVLTLIGNYGPCP